MSSDPNAYLRLSCFQLASAACNAANIMSPETVLEWAQKYYQWIEGKKVSLRITPNDNNGAAW